MDKIEKIRAEIERQIKKYRNDGFGCHANSLEKLLDFIDTLSEEPDKSLEEEVKNYFQGYWPGTETAEQCNTDLHFTPLAILRLARHFAQWGAEHAKKDKTPVPNDLEEAAKELFETMEIQEHENIFEDTFKKIFLAGAEWQKEQDDKLVDVIYQQGIEKGKDEMIELIKKEKENE